MRRHHHAPAFLCAIAYTCHAPPRPVPRCGGATGLAVRARRAAPPLAVTYALRANHAAGAAALPSLRLAPPQAFTHEGLASVACPVCGAQQSLEVLFQHLVTAHRQAHSLATYQSLCRDRLALYEEVVGRPLLTAEERRRSGLDVNASTAPVAQSSDQTTHSGWHTPSSSTPSAGAATTASVTAHSDGEAWRSQLPTVTTSGFVCNWCVLKQVFRTRDAFLMHVCHDHPLLNMDLVEPLVPRLPPAQTSPRTSADNAWQGSSSSSSVAAQARGGWGRDGLSAGSVPVSTRGAVPLRSVLRGAFAADARTHTTDDPFPNLSMRGALSQALRVRPQKGVSVPRALDEVALSAAPHTSARNTAFADDCFPCELCDRVFAQEMGLLQHLLTSHVQDSSRVGVTPESLDVAWRASAEQDVAHAMKHEAKQLRHPSRTAHRHVTGATFVGSVTLTCDLCTGRQRIYTLPSALFAHIRFKHPHEDAHFHVDRLLKAAQHAQLMRSSGTQPDSLPAHGEATAGSVAGQHATPTPTTVFACAFCSQVFGSAEARDSHMSDKHNVAATPAAATAERPAVSSLASPHSLPPVTLKTQWWCPTCEKGFVSARSLIAHCVGKHQRPLEALPCPACKRVLTDTYALEDHMNAAHPSLRFADLGLRPEQVTCANCQRLFLSQEALSAHVARHQACAAASTHDAPATEPASQRDEVPATHMSAPPTAPRKVARRARGKS